QLKRYAQPARTGSGTVQIAQQWTMQQQQQEAALASGKANLKVAQRQLEAVKAQRESAVANLAQANAQHDQAQLNLSYTIVTAAQAGRVVPLGAGGRAVAQARTNLTTFVADENWHTANFPEAQLHAQPP